MGCRMTGKSRLYPVPWRQRRWNGWLPYPLSAEAYGFMEWTVPQGWKRFKMHARKLRREMLRRVEVCWYRTFGS